MEVKEGRREREQSDEGEKKNQRSTFSQLFPLFFSSDARYAFPRMALRELVSALHEQLHLIVAL